MGIKRLIDLTEKLFLALIAGFTVIAMAQEILMSLMATQIPPLVATSNSPTLSAA
jgi:uncharacterized membrane protein YhaH (DUF805 family)